MCKLNHHIWAQIPHVNQNSLHILESAFNKLSIFIQGLCSSPKVTGIPIQTEPGQDRNRDRRQKEKWIVERGIAHHSLTAQKRDVRPPLITQNAPVCR